MGLYGLSSYIIQLRWREIAIRKVFGASVRQVVFLISTEFVLVVVLADLVAMPFAWWFSQAWLSNYSNRIDTGMFFLLAPAVGVVALAVVTVISQAARAAKGDPVVVMREV